MAELANTEKQGQKHI